MRRIMFGLVVISVAMLSFSPSAAQDKPWFDMENCAFCKNLLAEEGLMDHITKWEHHNVHNGSLSITVVDKEHLEAYKRAMHNMELVAEKLKQGEKLQMCGMCEAYGQVMQMGSKWEDVESDNIFVSLWYSGDPDVVARIHAVTNTTNDEMKKMQEAMKAEPRE